MIKDKDVELTTSDDDIIMDRLKPDKWYLFHGDDKTSFDKNYRLYIEINEELYNSFTSSYILERYVRTLDEFIETSKKDILLMSKENERFNELTKYEKTSFGHEISCKKGLWSVTAPTKEEAVKIVKHYFIQYLSDGEYDNG